MIESSKRYQLISVSVQKVYLYRRKECLLLDKYMCSIFSFEYENNHYKNYHYL